MKQHFVPRSYLKQFTNRNGKIHAIDLDLLKHNKNVHHEEKSLEQIARSIDYYTIKPEHVAFIPELGNYDPLYLEKEFHKYENHISRIVDQIKNQKSNIMIEDAKLLLYALIDLKLRNPYFHENVMDKKKDEVFNQLLGDDFEEHIRELDLTDHPLLSHDLMINSVEQLKHKFLNDPVYAKAMHLQGLVGRKSTNDNIYKKIIDTLLPCDWIVMKSKRQFITNDNPGVSVDDAGRVHNTKFSDNFMYFVPLAPSFYLTISPAAKDPIYRSSSKAKSIIYGNIDENTVNLLNAAHSHFMRKHIFIGDRVTADTIVDKINCNNRS